MAMPREPVGVGWSNLNFCLIHYIIGLICIYKVLCLKVKTELVKFTFHYCLQIIVILLTFSMKFAAFLTLKYFLLTEY